MATPARARARKGDPGWPPPALLQQRDSLGLPDSGLAKAYYEVKKRGGRKGGEWKSDPKGKTRLCCQSQGVFK